MFQRSLGKKSSEKYGEEEKQQTVFFCFFSLLFFHCQEKSKASNSKRAYLLNVRSVTILITTLQINSTKDMKRNEKKKNANTKKENSNTKKK